MADLYAYGHGVEQDYVKAFEWYIKSANQGYNIAQCKIGELYDGGYGVKQDYEKAFEWHIQSAEKGISIANTK